MSRPAAARLWPIAAAVLLALAASRTAQAHDTWLAARPDTERGERVLALATGEQFPVQQTAIWAELLRWRACGSLRDRSQRAWPLRWVADDERATLLRTTRSVPEAELLDCKVSMAPVPITLKPAVVAVYLEELKADAAIRERWRELQSRGLDWVERYSKNSRLLHGGGALPGPLPAGAIEPGSAMPLDVRLALPRWPLRVGDVLEVQLLRDGLPLPGHAVELRNDLSPIGLWRTTDAEGRFAIPLPLAARWLLRSIDLRPSTTSADAWESQFLSVTFEVLAPR